MIATDGTVGLAIMIIDDTCPVKFFQTILNKYHSLFRSFLWRLKIRITLIYVIVGSFTGACYPLTRLRPKKLFWLKNH